DPIKVTVVYKGDAYGIAFSAGLTDNLSFNSKNSVINSSDGNLAQFQYANTDMNPSFDFTPIINQVVAYQPSIIFLIGTNEAATVLTGVEKNWAMSARPIYLMADGLADSASTANAVAALPDELRTRIRGTIPGNANDPTYLSFIARFKAAYPGFPPSTA